MHCISYSMITTETCVSNLYSYINLYVVQSIEQEQEPLLQLTIQFNKIWQYCHPGNILDGSGQGNSWLIEDPRVLL